MTKRPPSMGPLGMNQSDRQVETTKIDPKAFLEQGLPGGGPQSEAESTRELEPLDLNAIPVRSAVDAAHRKQAEEKAAATLESFLPPEEEKDVLEEAVKDDLISRLEERFGMKPEVLHEVVVEAGGKELRLSMRLPLYDDFIWAVGSVQQSISRGEDLALVESEEQRAQMLQHLSSSRCVMKIEGEWIWDVFDYRSAIQGMVENWDGESYMNVPEAFMGVLARRVYKLFRHRLHPDLLFEMNRRVTELLEEFGPSKANAKDEENKESKDPTGAP